MGACCSKDTPLNEKLNSSSEQQQSGVAKTALEARIELAFKAKRANVFSANALGDIVEGEDEPRPTYVEKVIPKTSKQNKVIRTLLNTALVSLSAF
jgi:hypothetical protein